MINVILTYKQTLPFDASTQNNINALEFSQIPEMSIVETEIIIDDTTTKQFTIPYQANVKDELQFAAVKLALEQYGEVDVIGKWNDEGKIIDLDLKKYCDALKPIQEFEKATFINGEDFTGRENEFTSEKNEDGNDTTPLVRTFTREKHSTAPTLSQAKNIQVNVFNNQFKREL